MIKSKISIIVCCLCVVVGYGQERAVGINTELPRTTLDVNGKLTVRDTGNIENDGQVKALYVDKETGLIGTVAPSTPTAPITVLSAKSNNILPSTDSNAVEFNKGNTDLTVPLSSDDIFPNNLGVLIDNNTVVIQEAGTYQINAYLNMIISTPSTNKRITVEFPEVSTITGKPKTLTQSILIPAPYRLVFLYAMLKKNGTEIAGARPILTNILNNQSDIITLPTTTIKLAKGDRLSLAFNRTMSVSGGVTSPAGDDVSKIGIGANYAARPYSMTITKL